MGSLNFQFILVLFAALTVANGLSAQSDSARTRKNTVRYNITNPLIFGDKSLIFGYERTLRNNQSFSVNIGRTSYPKMLLINPDSIGLDADFQEKGFHISADYRFYLKKENKYPAPRGFYYGPYISYNYFSRVNTWSMDDPDYTGKLQTTLDMNIAAAGFQVGYQFLFWDRLSVDMIMMGPGLALYNIKATLSTDLSNENEDKFFKAINDYLEENIPGYNSVIDAGEFQKKGSSNTLSLGYRYMVMVGYHF
jgi:hypothetical protein